MASSLRAIAHALPTGRRTFALTLAGRAPSPSTVRPGAVSHHGGHHVPPEGDVDHGRSAYGFQSHDRHEHFTFPGEEQQPYIDAQRAAEDPWGQWKAPGVRKFALAAIGLYFYISYLPSRDSMRISHDPTRAASPVVASTVKISEEDVRPYWMRVWNYWGQGGEELHKEKMDWAWGEVDKSRQQSYFKLAVEPQTARKEIYFEPIKKEYLSGPQQTAHLKDWVPKTVINDELAVGIDRKTFDSQKKV